MSPNTINEKPSKRKQYILTADIEKSLAEIKVVNKALDDKIKADEIANEELKQVLLRLEAKINRLEEDIQFSYKNARRQFYSE